MFSITQIKQWLLQEKNWQTPTKNNCVFFLTFPKFHFVSLLRGEIDSTRLPCTCRLPIDIPRPLPLLCLQHGRQAGRETGREAANKQEAGQSSWGSRKKLGWHRNHPAPRQNSTSHNSSIHLQQVSSFASWTNTSENWTYFQWKMHPVSVTLHWSTSGLGS